MKNEPELEPSPIGSENTLQMHSKVETQSTRIMYGEDVVRVYLDLLSLIIYDLYEYTNYTMTQN
jgi:hypothetical protein